MALYTTITDAITQYTGLSPAAFFTISALMVVVYKIVSGMFVAADDYMAVKREQQFTLREPVQIGTITEDELRPYDGSDPNKPLLMAIKGKIYDVSRSRMFYGPGGMSITYSSSKKCPLSSPIHHPKPIYLRLDPD